MHKQRPKHPGVSFLGAVFLDLLSFLNLVLCACLFSLHVYLYLTCVPGAAGGQKRASGPLKLELFYYLNSSVWLCLMWDRRKTIFPGSQYCLIGVHRSCPQ